MLPPSIDQDSNFMSKTFLIRYCEEEVEINDIVLFRAELDVVLSTLQMNLSLRLSFGFQISRTWVALRNGSSITKTTQAKLAFNMFRLSN